MDLKRILLTLAPVAVAVVVGGCSNNWPYQPDFHVQPEAENLVVGVFSPYELFNINSNVQTCNPSISQDTTEYKGCMLWLNFDGQLNVNVADHIQGYTTEGVPQHDRITITDTNNTVVWYMKNTEMGIPATEHIQDPEWSTHSDYIACLGDVGVGILANDYRAFAVNVKSRAVMQLCNKPISDVATPHFWVERGPTSGAAGTVSYSDEIEGFADSASIASFFGTDQVQIVYSDNHSAINFVDYTKGTPKSGTLRKPEGKENWVFESPLISPNGHWVVYNCAQKINGRVYSAYAQRLDTLSTPILISENGVAPHWWMHPEFNELYVIYSTINGPYLMTTDRYTYELEAGGTLGRTYKVKVKAAVSDLPSHAGFSIEGNPILLIKLPFKGGLSPDGRYLATGYQYTFMAALR